MRPPQSFAATIPANKMAVKSPWSSSSWANSLATRNLVKELQDFCKENAAPYKYPRKIEFVDAGFLPKTISGKIKRAELKRMERERFERAKAKAAKL